MKELLEECKAAILANLQKWQYKDEMALYNVLQKIELELAKPAPEPDYWHVVDEYGLSIYSATFKQACHDHINDALNNSNAFQDLEAEKWKVQGLFVKPPAKQKPLSDDEIKQLWEESLLNTNSFTRKFVRSIEKAHGIIG